MIRNKTFKLLQKQFENVKGEQKTKVNDLLKLYEDGHIFSKIAIQKAINDYLAPVKNPLERELKYYKTIANYRNVDTSFKHKRDKTTNRETKEN